MKSKLYIQIQWISLLGIKHYKICSRLLRFFFHTFFTITLLYDVLFVVLNNEGSTQNRIVCNKFKFNGSDCVTQK